jgi:hypothetical protein
MAEIKEFVINDRRKFTAEGDVRPDAPPSEPKPPRPEASLGPESSARLVETPVPHALTEEPAPEAVAEPEQAPLPMPTAEQTSQAKRAFDATVDRLDTAIRATNPGMEPMPPMTFERVVQSIYMQALLQLGGAAAPGQQPQVDPLGARQTIDMLAIFAEKTKGNLSAAEDNLLQTALFELHMGFLEVTQALARQAAAQQQAGKPGSPAPSRGPSIVR